MPCTFWAGYILTRPFGAALGDFLTQDCGYGALGMGPLWTSALLLTVVVLLVAAAQFGMATARTARSADSAGR